jgi:hypothetical protein
VGLQLGKKHNFFTLDLQPSGSTHMVSFEDNFIFAKTYIIFVAFGQLFWQKEKVNVQKNITPKFVVSTLHMLLCDKAEKVF